MSVGNYDHDGLVRVAHRLFAAPQNPVAQSAQPAAIEFHRKSLPEAQVDQPAVNQQDV